MTLDFETIRRGLQELRSLPIQQDDLCARFHRYTLNPPLSEEKVRAFEVGHRIALPADYRGFLIHVGNGGAGPSYGVFKLGETDDGWGHAPWRENDGFVGTLSAPFPHTEPWNETSRKPEYDETNEEESERCLSEFDERYFNPSNVNGAIPICHLGCALRLWLVVTGPEAGHIWCDDRADYAGLSPLQQGNAQRVSFIEWYCSWLADALRRHGIQPRKPW
jgi:hypothetical protein